MNTEDIIKIFLKREFTHQEYQILTTFLSKLSFFAQLFD